MTRMQGIAIHRPILYGNTAVTMTQEEAGESGHTHRWTVCVRSAASPVPDPNQPRGTDGDDIGGGDDLSYFIRRVSFKLHETYPTPLRSMPPFSVLCNLLSGMAAIDRPPFEVTETGWGEFEIQIRIYFVNEASEKPLIFNHHLKLHPWPSIVMTGPNNINAGPNAPAPAPAPTPVENGAIAPSAEGDLTPAEDAVMTQTNGDAPLLEQAVVPIEPAAPPAPVLSPVHSFQYDEVVFTDPTEVFYNILTSYPPTSLCVDLVGERVEADDPLADRKRPAIRFQILPCQ